MQHFLLHCRATEDLRRVGLYAIPKERSFNLLLGFGGSEEECERAKVFLGKAWEVRQEAERLREGDMTGTASVNAPFQGGGVLEG